MMNKLHHGAAFLTVVVERRGRPGRYPADGEKRRYAHWRSIAGLVLPDGNELGQGRILLLGSLPAGDEGSEMLVRMLIHYGKEANVTWMAEVTTGTIVALRESETEELWVIVNMNGEGGSVTLPREGFDKLSGERVTAGRLEVGRYEYRMIASPSGFSKK